MNIIHHSILQMGDMFTNIIFALRSNRNKYVILEFLYNTY